MRDADRYVRSLPSVREERKGWRYQSVPGFFLGEGQGWTDLVPFTEVDAANVDRAFMDRGQCFWNAAQLVASDPERFTYCEGYAMIHTNAGVAMQHAWAVDQDGQVVDTTWAREWAHDEDPEGTVTSEEGRYYFGVAVPAEAHSRWMDGTRGPTLMHDRRLSSRVLMRHGLAEGMRRDAHLADYSDPAWTALLGRYDPEACGMSPQ